MKILANDGLAKSGINALQTAGFEVITDTVAQE
ncbi:MAG: D-3-phosphoglycerate dehydrogenase, partial [Flavobacteriales bacterium]